VIKCTKKDEHQGNAFSHSFTKEKIQESWISVFLKCGLHGWCHLKFETQKDPERLKHS